MKHDESLQDTDQIVAFRALEYLYRPSTDNLKDFGHSSPHLSSSKVRIETGTRVTAERRIAKQITDLGSPRGHLAWLDWNSMVVVGDPLALYFAIRNHCLACLNNHRCYITFPLFFDKFNNLKINLIRS